MWSLVPTNHGQTENVNQKLHVAAGVSTAAGVVDRKG